MEIAGNPTMDDLEIKQRMANLDKAYAEIEKMRTENQRLLEMLPVEIEKARAESQRILEMAPFEIEKAKAEARKLDREWRWYPWLGTSGAFALAIALLKLLGH